MKYGCNVMWGVAYMDHPLQHVGQREVGDVDVVRARWSLGLLEGEGGDWCDL